MHNAQPVRGKRPAAGPRDSVKAREHEDRDLPTGLVLILDKNTPAVRGAHGPSPLALVRGTLTAAVRGAGRQTAARSAPPTCDPPPAAARRGSNPPR